MRRFSGTKGRRDISGGRRKRKGLRVPFDHPARNVDLLQLDSCIARVLDFARNEHGPELCADMTAAQALEIGVAAGTLAQVIGVDVSGRPLVFANHPREIVVSVDQRRCRENSPGANQRRIS